MIPGFFHEYRYLSNFHEAKVVFEGVTYPSVEHAYQAAKLIDPKDRAIFATDIKPAVAKKLGSQARVRDDWFHINLGIMEDLVRQKFKDLELAKKLVDTGTEDLVEYNTWGDKFWGVCDGEGLNHLGKILMKIRSELQALHEFGNKAVFVEANKEE